MEKITELLELLRTATPMLQEFLQWKAAEAEKEKQQQEEQSQAEKEFDNWLKQREIELQQQERETEDLQKHFFGGEEWEKERYSPSFF